MKISQGLVLFLLLFTLELSAQSIQGKWKISSLIIDSVTQEYTLRPLGDNYRDNYGNTIVLTDSNRFYTYYTAPCGNDCFVSSTGKYILTDQEHIQFIIEKVSFDGECNSQTSEYSFPLDIGLYYIHRNNDQVYLIKSKGNISQDKINISYVDSIDATYEESKKFKNLLEWIKPDINLEKKPLDIAAYYFSTIADNNFEVLYSKDVDYGLTIILIKVNNEFNYLFCHTFVDTTKSKFVYDLALYDKHFVNRRANSVEEINRVKAEKPHE